MKAALSREEKLFSPGEERARRAPLLGTEKDPRAEEEACGVGSEVSHRLCSDISLPYGSHQQFFCFLMPQLELDQGRSWGRSCKEASNQRARKAEASTAAPRKGQSQHGEPAEDRVNGAVHICHQENLFPIAQKTGTKRCDMDCWRWGLGETFDVVLRLPLFR